MKLAQALPDKLAGKLLCLVFTISVVPFASPLFSQTEQELHKSCAILSKPGQYPDYEGLPSYAINTRHYDTSTPPVLVLQISVVPGSIEGSGAMRLGCQLKMDFPKEAAIYATIFDDKKASQRLRIGYTDEVGYGLYLWHIRGRYELNRKTQQEFIEVLIPEADDGLLSLKRIKHWLTD